MLLPVPAVDAHDAGMSAVLADITPSVTRTTAGVGGAITEHDEHRDHHHEAVRRLTSAAIEGRAAPSRSHGRDPAGVVPASPASVPPTTNDLTRRAVCVEHYRRRELAHWAV